MSKLLPLVLAARLMGFVPRNYVLGFNQGASYHGHLRLITVSLSIVFSTYCNTRNKLDPFTNDAMIKMLLLLYADDTIISSKTKKILFNSP